MKLKYLPDIQTVIADYGFVESAFMDETGLSAKIRIAFPQGKAVTSERDLRAELYLQAESVISLLEKEYKLWRHPWISIHDGNGFVEGTVEVYLQ